MWIMRKKSDQIQTTGVASGSGKKRISTNCSSEETSAEHQKGTITTIYQEIRKASFEKAIEQAVDLLQKEKHIQLEISKHAQDSCTSCGKRAIKYAQNRLTVVNSRLATCGSRIIRLAKQRMSNT
jgi:hypothetical protein